MNMFRTWKLGSKQSEEASSKDRPPDYATVNAVEVVVSVNEDKEDKAQPKLNEHELCELQKIN